jgi:anti-sigma factor RsiW
MNCANHQELLSRFVDGELELRLQSELFGHLASCSACQEWVDGLVRLKAEIRRERVPYPQELDEAVLGGILRSTPGRTTAAVEQALPGGGWGRRVTAPLRIAVPVVIVIILAGILLGRVIFPPEVPRPHPATTRTENARTLPANFVYGMPPVEIYGAPDAQSPAGSVEPKR